MQLSIICPTYPSTGQVGDLTICAIKFPSLGAYSHLNSPYFPPTGPHTKPKIMLQIVQSQFNSVSEQLCTIAYSELYI